jgi:putative zinc ribbon protein
VDGKHKNCQSCGMPMKRDERGGGTNVDGSRNGTYCSHCFANGKFTAPDMSVGEMQDLVRGKLKEFGFPSFLAGMFTRRIPRLGRWKSTSA